VIHILQNGLVYITLRKDKVRFVK